MGSLFKGRRGVQSEGRYVAVAAPRCLACNWDCGTGSEERTSRHVARDVKKSTISYGFNLEEKTEGRGYSNRVMTSIRCHRRVSQEYGL